MLQARRISDHLTVSAQIRPKDVAEIAAAGYKSIICNRPDNEEADQTTYSEIEAEAHKHGLEIHWQPIISGLIKDEQGREFGELLSRLPQPTFAYCRSGGRCAQLWALSEAGLRPTAYIIRDAAVAGYNLAGMIPRLEAIAAAAKD